VQRLQFFLSESRWDPERVNTRRLELLLGDPATAPHGAGVLVVDDSSDRKGGTRTAHVGHQWLGRCGKADSGVVTVTTLWADGRLYYPVHAVPYTPAGTSRRGRSTRGRLVRRSPAAGHGTAARDRRWREGAARRAAGAVLAPDAARRARLAFPVDRAAALVAGLVQGAPAAPLQALMDSVAAGRGLHLCLRS
jgi:hypothetical protein